MTDRKRADRALGEALLREARGQGIGGRPLGEILVWVGRQFLGTPYQASPLEGKGPERLVADLHAFDCVTFVETSLALAWLIRQGTTDFRAYPPILTRIRYRRGCCNGYASRLHYFTDWLFDAGRKGLVRDVTPSLDGIPYPKAFHTLTDRRAEIPALGDSSSFRRLRIVETCCSRRPLTFLPKAAGSAWEGKIREGDLLAITTDRPGIDVLHVGIAARDRQGFRLLHASSAAGKVVLTKGTVGGYLAEKAERTGVIVGRPTAERRTRRAGPSGSPGRAWDSPCRRRRA